jgi:hypothetical protein
MRAPPIFYLKRLVHARTMYQCLFNQLMTLPLPRRFLIDCIRNGCALRLARENLEINLLLAVTQCFGGVRWTSTRSALAPMATAPQHITLIRPTDPGLGRQQPADGFLPDATRQDQHCV